MKLVGSAVWLIGCSLALQSSCGESQTGPTAPTAPTITAIVPAEGPVGTTVTVEGSGFSPTGNVVKFGVGYLSDLASPDGRRLLFTVPEGHNICPPSELGDREPCAGGVYPRVQPGSHAVSVVTRTETSRQVLFTVTER
jgi:IPT/TIG domain